MEHTTYVYAIKRGVNFFLCEDGWFRQGKLENGGIEVSSLMKFGDYQEAQGVVTLLTARYNADGRTMDLWVGEDTELKIGETYLLGDDNVSENKDV